MSKIDLSEIVTAAVTSGLNAAAGNRNNDLKQGDVPAVAKTVAGATKAVVEKEVKDRTAHLTNTEAHWWQKRSRLSAIIGTAAPVLGVMMKMLGIEAEFGAAEQVALTDALMAIGGLWAAYLAYRAGVAAKPLGE